MPQVMPLEPAIRSKILAKVREDLKKASKRWDVMMGKAIKDPDVYGVYAQIDEHIKTGGYIKSKKFDFDKGIIVDRGI